MCNFVCYTGLATCSDTHMWAWVCVRVCACTTSRRTEEWWKRWWDRKSGETCVICIYEYLVNHILDKYETILILFLRVIWVLLYVYFGG